MAAFRAAIAAGYGIECDVRASRDGVAMVFHDASLTRMTGTEAAVEDSAAERLDQARLHDGGTIPRLEALLTLCGCDTPLLIEIKVQGRYVAPVCLAVAEALAPFSSAQAAVMSFNPVAMRWFARHRPKIVRGLVVTEQDRRGWRGRISRSLALWMARPDFVACDIRDLPSPLSSRLRARGVPVLTWTVRTQSDRSLAAATADQIIFEDGHG